MALDAGMMNGWRPTLPTRGFGTDQTRAPPRQTPVRMVGASGDDLRAAPGHQEGPAGHRPASTWATHSQPTDATRPQSCLSSFAGVTALSS